MNKLNEHTDIIPPSPTSTRVLEKERMLLTPCRIFRSLSLARYLHAMIPEANRIKIGKGQVISRSPLILCFVFIM